MRELVTNGEKNVKSDCELDVELVAWKSSNVMTNTIQCLADNNFIITFVQILVYRSVDGIECLFNNGGTAKEQNREQIQARTDESLILGSFENLN